MASVYRALRARGADVCMATHGGTHEFYLRAANIPFDLLEPRMAEERCRQFVADGAGQGAPNQSFYTDQEMRAEVSAQVAYFRERGVRAVLTGFSLTTLLSTRLVGVPLAASHAGSSVPPVYERGIFPAPSRPQPALLRLLPEAWLKRFSNWGVEHLRLYCGGFNRLARELGVEEIPSFADLLLGDLNLVTDIPEILGIPKAELEGWTPRRPRSYRRRLKLRYVGPIFADLHQEVPGHVRAFLQRRDARPIVYVALTSTRPEVVTGSIRALQATGARVLAVSTVHTLNLAADPDLLVEPFLPSIDIMPHVDLAVTAGGQGSVQTAMVCGTPLIGVPLQPEQDLNVDLIERQGAGVRLPLRLAGTPTLTARARSMLAEPRFKQNARRLQGLMTQVDGPGNAADLLMRLAASGFDAV